MSRLLLAIFICFLLLSCQQKPWPKAFIIPKEATAVEHLKFRGMDQLSYQLNIAFPATTAIQTIVKRVEAQGWQPLGEKYLQPGSPTSHESGWTYHEDNRVGGDSFLYEWTCDWQDKNSNILHYTFQYRDRVEKYRKKTYILKPGSSNLRVIAIYMPQEVALRIREEALRKPKGAAQTQTR